MLDFFYKIDHFFSDETLFWFCALAGSGMFIIQLIINILGADNTVDGENEIELGKFQWLSKQALTGFLLMFGWTGLTCRNEFDFSTPLSIAIATLCGLFAMFVTVFIFTLLRKLRSRGTEFNIDDSIGKEALVYHRIPAEGAGKITLSLYNFTHEIDALSLNQEEIPSFTSVKIVKKADEKTVVVRAIK